MLISIYLWRVTVDTCYDHEYALIYKIIHLKLNNFISYHPPIMLLLLLSHSDIEFNPEKEKNNKEERTKTIFILSLVREWKIPLLAAYNAVYR